MPYDLFISYSRRDNKQGQVTALKKQIEADYLSFAKEKLRCFFDLEDIASMDDWRHRILEGLRDSNLLLLVLSPAYLDSPYCEWEVVEFLKYEHSRSVGGQGVTPVYFVEIPGLDEPGFEQRAASWVARVRRRNHVDLRPWFHEGVEALKQADVRHRLDDLERSLHTRLSKLRRLRNAPGNLPAHNPRFVGREAEMQRLHEAAGLGRFGVLTAVHGMGGVGKTALAIQYAYAYADFYPGGRWLVGCAGATSLAAAIRKLEPDLGITPTDDEKRDDNLAARRVLAELERRTVEGARARSGEKVPPEPKALLLLDNVDVPTLLQPPESDLVSGRQWLHVLATTRSCAENFGNDPEHLTVLSIDDLPMDDALRLIESYQPKGRFPNSQERDAALELAKLLGGFTLAVEVVAVYLGERAGLTTCAAFLERMKKEGLGKFDDIIRGTKNRIRHGEILVGATLKPTLDLLSEPELLVLGYAALLPPDAIPLPWLRALVAEVFPELGRDAGPGYDDPWLSLVNHLLGLRLLQTIELAEDGRTPRLMRMHRMLGGVMRTRFGSDQDLRRRDLCVYVKIRCNELEQTRYEDQWEIPPLIAFAQELLERNDTDAPGVIWSLCGWLPRFDGGRNSEPMLRASLARQEQNPGSDPNDLFATLLYLGTVLGDLGQYREGETMLRRALEWSERVLGPEHPSTLTSVNTLAGLLDSKGDYAGAQPLYERALEARERVLGPEHPSTLTSVNNLAGLLSSKGDYAGAQPLYERALAASERVLGPEHPDTLTSVNNLAGLLSSKGDYAGARPLYERALEARERVLGPEHPGTLGSVNNLALLLESKGDYAGAQPLYERALEARERVLGPEHPDTLNSADNLSEVLEKTGQVEEAISLRLRVLEAKERTLRREHPDMLRGWNNRSHVLRKGGYADQAEPIDRKLVETTAKVLGDANVLTLHRRNNLVLTLVLLGKLEEARAMLATNWRLNAPPHANTTPRIVYLRYIVALLDSEQNTSFLGEVKTLLTGPELPEAADVAVPWDIAYFIEHLRPKLTPGSADFLTALVAALNDRATVPDLERFAEWKNQAPIPLDAPWPG